MPFDEDVRFRRISLEKLPAKQRLAAKVALARRLTKPRRNPSKPA